MNDISVSVLSDYGLHDRAVEVRSPAEAKDFSSSLCVQIGSGAHPASCTMVPGILSPGVKRGRGVTLTTHPHLVPRSRMSRSYTSSPLAPPQLGCGTASVLTSMAYLISSTQEYFNDAHSGQPSALKPTLLWLRNYTI
jgi:hypothetical protein